MLHPDALYAIVEEAALGDEFHENNNVRSTIVTGPEAQPGDPDLDGDVDLVDYARLQQVLGP